MPSGHWKYEKNSFKKCNGNVNEAQTEEAEEEHDMSKISERRYKKIEFKEELSK